MSTPYGPREPNGSDPYQPGQQQPGRQQPGQPGTYAPEEDIPRQQGSREDAGQQPGPGQGSYRAYPQSGTGASHGAGPSYGGLGTLSYLQGAPVGFADAVRRYHIRTIVNVQDEFPDPDLDRSFWGTGTLKERALCESLGVRYVHLAPDLVSRRLVGLCRSSAIEDFLAVMDDKDN